MRTITAEDIQLDHDVYAATRDEARARTIALKKVRRLSLGDVVTVLFENHDTLRHQVQEMVFVERITDAEALAQEIATYAPLLPTSYELSATLFLEMPDMATLKAELPRLVGIEQALRLVVGAGDAERVVPGIGEGGRSRDDYTSTVHYVRFPLDDAARAMLLDLSVPARLEVEHPAYADSAVIGAELRAQLAADLAG